jgi:hypothetical protein
MKFIFEKYHRLPINKYNESKITPISQKNVFVAIKVELDDNELDNIYDEAKKLAEDVCEKNPSGEVRTEERKLLSSFCGLIAEKVVKQLISEKLMLIKDCVKIKGANVSSENFNYESHNDIEIHHLLNGDMTTIEVRSSIPYMGSFDKVLNKEFDILGYYITSYKSNEPKKDYYFRVLFHNPRDYKNDNLKYAFNNKDTGINHFKKVKVYFVGGCTLNDLENHGEPDNLKQGNAEYKVIRPITKGRDALEILEILEKDILIKLKI